MRVANIVRRLCQGCRNEIHEARLAGVIAVAEAIALAGRLSITSVGRSIRSLAFPKHSIKRVDRLLSNTHLQLEDWRYYASIAQLAIGTCPRPVVLLDWTQVTSKFHALVAAVPVGGRALTIYQEVHPERLLGNDRVHALFLKNLQRVLPAGCIPIIVTDAGFQGPFFRKVLKRGWNFVGRIRGKAKCEMPSGWCDLQTLKRRASAEPRDLGIRRLYRTQPLQTRMILVRAKRRAKHPWRKTSTPRGRANTTTISGAKEPWLLATSLTDDGSHRIVKIYSKRMQIEETFRDEKNHRFGWSLRHVRSHSADRLQVLLLLTTLATAAVTLLGAAAVSLGLQRRYQANTVKDRVFSDFVLGTAVLKRNDTRGLAGPLRRALLQWTVVLAEITS